MAVRTIIADGNQLARFGLNTVLGTSDGINVCGDATCQEELFRSISDLEAEVVIIDFLSDGFSVDSVVTVKQKFPNLKCVAITTEQSGHTIVNALKAGIDSYIKKDCSLDEIRDAVVATGNGDTFFCGQILKAIAKEQINVDEPEFNSLNCEPIQLSEREMEVIKLISEGFTNARIAEKLFLSSHTVTTHRKNIMQKLGVNNTASIVMYAVKTGLVSPDKYLFSRPL
ncbi:MAG: response regulator transcription factor [Flavobacteriales bacterium]|nr:response regulator transcription factor [Flavobacteriales bacterium]